MNIFQILFKRGLHTFLLTLLAGAIASCGLVRSNGSPFDQIGLAEGFGLDKDDGWIVLSRPNSIWTVGTVIEVVHGREAKDLGTLASLGCFPPEAWLVIPGTGPGVQYGRTIDYGISISATLGIPNAELAHIGLSFGGDGTTPTHKVVIALNKETQQRVDMLKAEEYLEANFESMSDACRRNLLNPDRFIVDKIRQIEDGEISFVEIGGAKVDISSPKFQVLQDAAAKVGYSVTKSGTLKIPVGTPITVAIRQADFRGTLARIGIEIKGDNRLKDFMEMSGEAVPY